MVGATIAAGRVIAVDTSAAEAAPGVFRVITHRNAPKLMPVPIFPQGPAGEGRPPLQDDVVAYAGQAVAVVVARSTEEAQHAADLVAVTYEAMPALTTLSLGSGDMQPVPLPAPLARRFDLDRGDAEAALATAAFSVETTADTPAHSQSAMELAATVAVPDELSDRLHLL